MKLSRTQRLARLGTAAMSLLFLVGPTVGATSAAADGETTLIVQGDAFKNNFNPWTSYVSGDRDILTNIYPSLAFLDEASKPQPYLAESWTTSEDGLTWTFKIRSGLTWSDGQPLTAKDAAFTYNLIMTNKSAGTSNGALVTQWESVQAPDDTTLIVKTKVPVASMLKITSAGGAQPGIPIVPQHIWESKVNDLAADSNLVIPTVGYGPWTLTDFEANQFATLTANKEFVLGAPKYDKLIYRQYTTPDAAVAALRSGELNMAGLTPVQAQAMDDATVTSYGVQGALWLSIAINTGGKTKSGKTIGTANPVMADPAIRDAINHGMDRDLLVERVLGGDGVANAAFLPSQYTENWQPKEKITFDPQESNRILDEAGYTKGADGLRVDPKTNKPLVLRLGTHSEIPEDAQVAEYFVGWMRDIGIEIKLEPMSFSLLNDNLAKGDWDMLFDRWGTGPDPTYLLSTQTCAALPDDNGENGNTDSFYCNPEFDKLFELQGTQVDPAQRMATFHQMLDILYTNGNNLILFYANGLFGVRTDKTANYVIGSPDADGLYPEQNLFLNWRQAEPIGGAVESGSNTGMIIAVAGGAVVLIGAAAAFVALRRRSSADSKE